MDDAPTISAISDVDVNEDESTSAIVFVVTAIDADDDEADFTVTATSADGDVIPDGNLVLGGSESARTITVTPAAESSSVSPIAITITVTDDDGLTASTTFGVTVNAVNDAPTLTSVPGDQSMLEDGANRQLNVGIADMETSAEALTLTAVSSMPSVLGVTVSSEGGTRTVTLSPQANRFGTVTITLSLSDGDRSAMATFDVTLDPVNDAPTASTTATLPATVNEDAGTITIPFVASDIDIDGVFPPQVPAQSLSYSLTHTNDHPGLITGLSVVGSSVVVTIADDLYGDETITLTVTDDGTPALSSQLVLPILVLSTNDAPTLEQLANVTVHEDSGVTNVTFDVADVDSLNVAVGAAASNPGLFEDLSVSEWEGGNRTVTLSLQTASDAHGSSLITITATDGIAATEMTFTVTVTPVNDPPTIVMNSPNPQNTLMNTTTGPIHFTVTDIDNPPCSLVLTSTTTAPTLLPTRTFSPSGSCVETGDSAMRSLTITPGMNVGGSGQVTVRVSDGSFFSQFAFTVNVQNPA